jgi:hypothetical protein
MYSPTACFEELYRTWTMTDAPLSHRYRRLRETLEQIIHGDMINLSLQATDLAARINYIAARFGLTAREQYDLHTFRLTSNAVMNRRRAATEQEFARDVRAIAMAFRKILGQDLPRTCRQWWTASPTTKPPLRTPRRRSPPSGNGCASAMTITTTTTSTSI